MKDIIQELVEIVGDVYGVKKEIPEHLISRIDERIYREVLEQHNIMIIYNEQTKEPQYVKRVD